MLELVPNTEDPYGQLDEVVEIEELIDNSLIVPYSKDDSLIYRPWKMLLNINPLKMSPVKKNEDNAQLIKIRYTFVLYIMQHFYNDLLLIIQWSSIMISF